MRTDSSAPTWDNMINGQVNLYDANRRQVDFKQGQKEYKLRTDRTLPTLIVRPRGWHLEEKHVTVDGEPISGSLFDFGLYFYHNAFESVKRGHGPYFYLPKMESHLEARLWNDAFNLAQDYIGMPRGTIRGTVLIETILAAFEMDEIIYELRDHSSGLNCGRWDYIFSVIKKFRQNSNFVLPDRSAVTMTVPFMDAYVKLLIQTCHKRGVHAMGGMAAQIPIKDDKEANDKAMEGVRADKLREVRAGHDGYVRQPLHIFLENRHGYAADVLWEPSLLTRAQHMGCPPGPGVNCRRDLQQAHAHAKPTLQPPRGRQDWPERPPQHERPRPDHRGGHPQEPEHRPRLHGGLGPGCRLRAYQLPDVSFLFTSFESSQREYMFYRREM